MKVFKTNGEEGNYLEELLQNLYLLCFVIGLVIML
jgi:hypothetical protein